VREQVFWGWGEPGAGPALPAQADDFLRAELGLAGGVVEAPVALEDVRLPAPELPEAARDGLVRGVGAAHVLDDRESRVLRCRGKSYLDLLAQRAGDCEGAPDAVVRPGDHEQVADVLRVCAEHGVAVVPFGGGTSVVGGLEARREGFAGRISLDLGRMDAVDSVDERSLTAVLGPGLRLPEAERALGAHGLRLAHVPQSFEWATVGGCVATRSAGQSSTGHGRIDENVVAVRCVAPAGDLATLGAPASAAGPALRELVVGSEGALGVITRVALRVRPVAEARRHEGWFARSFADGCEALRRLEQEGLAPDLARLSDEAETRVSLALAGPGGRARRTGQAATRALGYGDGCVLVLGWEGEERGIGARRRPAASLLRRAGLLYGGRGPGEAWAHARFAGPHLRDDLLDRGALAETLETATSWSGLQPLRDAVARALRDTLGQAVVGCHVSHLYPTGASLYFTVLAARDSEDPAGQWERAKRAAGDAIAAAGATITHHHAVGRDHAPWLEAEHGRLGVELLRALKERCDPAGIMNPGVLVDAF
jgi:alkyldihydroxyacetonephosphate synthase